MVASGGAVKGVFHIGVLQALKEYSIPIHTYVGASAGALISAFAATSVSPYKLQEAFLSSRRRSVPRLTRFHIFYLNNELFYKGLGASGIFDLSRMERYLRDNLPVNDFRKLKKDLYITAVNLHTGNRVVFGKGYVADVPISQAVAASMALVPFFKPYCIDGVPLIDGEFKKTFSMDLAMAAGAKTIFASNTYVPYHPRRFQARIHQSGILNILRQALYILLQEKIYMGIELYQKDFHNVNIYFIESDNRDFFVEAFDLYRAAKIVRSGYEKTLSVLQEAGFQKHRKAKLSLVRSSVA